VLKKILISFALVLLAAFSAGAAETKQILHVDVSLFPPMVIENNDGTLGGFDVDFLNAIADELGISVSYHAVPFDTLLKDLKEKKVDIAISGLSITESREESFDFSHPYFDSGLRIAVLKKEPDQFAVFGVLKQIVYSSEIRSGFFLLLGVVMFSGFLFWLVERGKGAVGSGFEGLLSASYFSMVTAATVGYGDIAPKMWKGRIIALFTILAGIGIFSIFQSQLTSTMTAQKIEYDISSATNLRGKKVATVKGTTSIDSLKSLGVNIIPVARIEDAYVLLDRGKVKAVVYDSPTILNYVQHEGAGKVVVVGDLFDPQYYAIAFPAKSELRERVNRAILKLKTNGVYDKLYTKWFGALS